jgi:UDP-N-acetyl-D-mannosaminuronic acid dehydrogenase
MISSKGFKVFGTDIDVKKVRKLKKGELTFSEPGLNQLFEQAKMNNIEFTNEYVQTDFYIITVPTPFINATKKIDSTYVVNAFNSVLEVCLDNSVIIIESTISPGFIEEYIYPLIESDRVQKNRKISIVHAPERILPGNMLLELVKNSRTIGLENQAIKNVVNEVYSSFCESEIIYTDIKTAEMSKVVENTFRDINIAFANELARICHESRINVYDVIKIANMHPRVNILNPGPGVGGHCIPIDPWFLVGEYPKITKLIHSARVVNESMIDYVFLRIQEEMSVNKIRSFKKVGLYGISYKENVDDFRESPTLKIIERYNHNFILFDPHVPKKMFKNQEFDFNKFIEKVDLVVVLVGHNHIIENEKLLEGKFILDFKNVLLTKNKSTI